MITKTCIESRKKKKTEQAGYTWREKKCHKNVANSHSSNKWCHCDQTEIGEPKWHKERIDIELSSSGDCLKILKAKGEKEMIWERFYVWFNRVLWLALAVRVLLNGLASTCIYILWDKVVSFQPTPTSNFPFDIIALNLSLYSSKSNLKFHLLVKC